MTVNIAPDTSTKVSNKVYWKSYGNDGGKNDVIPDFSYNLNAGGSTTTTDNPHLTIMEIRFKELKVVQQVVKQKMDSMQYKHHL